MGSAFYETKGVIKGTAGELAAFAQILGKYTGKSEGIYFMACSFEAKNGDEIPFTASGPYGKFDRLLDVPVFREMAEAAPHAFFDIQVSGNTDFTEEEIKYQLAEGKLRIETESSDNGDDDEAYLEYVIEKMPYAQFVEIYQIDPDSFEEDSYEDFINDLIIDADEDGSPFDLEFADFRDLLEGYGGKTVLKEETWPEAAMKTESLAILPAYDYREENDHTESECFVYDPIARKWLD